MTKSYSALPKYDDESAEAMTRPPELTPEPKPKPRRRLRNLFWPGFAVGFLLLTFASCGGVVLATGLDRIDLTHNNRRAWTPPIVTATPVATAAPDNASTVGEAGGAFSMGQQLHNVTSSQVNIRAAPGYLSKPNGDVIGQVPSGGQIKIIGGHTSADGLTWWYSRYTAPDGVAIDGWIAEATASGVQILGQ